MSRAVFDRLCQEIRQARTARSLFVASLRPKATSATALQESAVSDDWSHDVIEKKASACPITSSRQTAVRPGGASSERMSQRAPSRSAHFSVAQDLVQNEEHLRRSVSVTLPPDTPTIDAPPRTTAPPHLDFGNARPFSEMPAPQSLPIIGTLWMHMPGGPLYGLAFEEKTIRMQEMYGFTVRENVLLNFNMVHVYRPEDMEAVYRAQGTRPRRDAFNMLKKYNNDYSNKVQGLLTSQGDAWHRLRSKAQTKMLKPKSASAYLDLHNAVSTDFLALIDRLRDRDGVIEDLLPDLYKFAMEGIGCVCFNRRLGALEENISKDSDTYRFIEAVSHVMEASHSELKRFFLLSTTPTFRKLVRAQSFIKQLSIQEAERTLEMFSHSDRTVDGESGDLIPYLMTKTNLSEAEVMTLISEFFFAGVDTTSHLLGFALYLVSLNPEVQEKLTQEIDQVVEGNDVITAQTLGRLSYLKALTKETFRMCPISPGNGRTLETDIVLGGYHVPAGIMLGLHHDWAGKSEKYVKEPERFMPERWLRGNTSPYADINPFIVMPFGFGPRSCVGRRFAEQEFALAMIKIFQKYRVEYAHHEALRYEMCIVNKPLTPLKFRFVPRK